jgi:site-specific recombinase
MSFLVHEALQRFAGEPPEVAAAALRRLKSELMAAPDTPAECMEAAVAALRADPLLRATIATRLGALLGQVRHRFLYADTGVLEPLSFGRTLRSRLGARLLPHVPDPGLLRDLFGQMFATDADIEWVHAVPPAAWAGWFALMLEAIGFAAGAAQAAREGDAALALLAARAAGLAADPDRVRYRRAVSGAAATHEEEVLELPAATRAWIAGQAGDAVASPKELLRRLANAQADVEALREAAPTHGTSLALLHSLHAAHQTLERMRQLVLIRAAADLDERSQRAAALFVELVAAQRTEHSLRHVFAQVADDVSQRITEHASQTGEHYVTDDRPQWLAMLRAAAGAGALVALMALLKIFIVRAHFAPLWQYLAICLNYGLGFVLIHLLHFTVATKQPAMTATLLAARLDQEEATPAGAARLADLVVRMVRTQVVAIVGNVALAAPTALVLFFAVFALGHVAPVTDDKARALLAELRPWQGWALLHAAIAGGCLFVAGVISGYYDNLCVFGRVGERLSRHPVLLRLLKPARAVRLACYIENNLGALLGNLAFGFLLGGAGLVGFLTGLPIDIRHVAFASANSAYALGALASHSAPIEGAIAMAVLGVVLVGIVNVTVSFALAFATAFRARHVRYERARLVMRLVLRRLVRRPWDFVWPPADAGARKEEPTPGAARRDEG